MYAFKLKLLWYFLGEKRECFETVQSVVKKASVVDTLLAQDDIIGRK